MDDTNLVEKHDLIKTLLFWKSVIVRMEEWENVLSCSFYRIWEIEIFFKMAFMSITYRFIGDRISAKK